MGNLREQRAVARRSVQPAEPSPAAKAMVQRLKKRAKGNPVAAELAAALEEMQSQQPGAGGAGARGYVSASAGSSMGGSRDSGLWDAFVRVLELAVQAPRDGGSGSGRGAEEGRQAGARPGGRARALQPAQPAAAAATAAGGKRRDGTSAADAGAFDARRAEPSPLHCPLPSQSIAKQEILAWTSKRPCANDCPIPPTKSRAEVSELLGRAAAEGGAGSSERIAAGR